MRGIKHHRVTITSAGVMNPVNYPVYPPELKIPEYKSPKDEEKLFCDVRYPDDPERKTYDQVDSFKKVIRAYRGRDEDADKYVKKVKAIIGKPLDDLELEQVRIAVDKVKCPRKLDTSVLYQLTGRLPYEDLNHDDERLLFHFYDTFYNESIKLFGKTIRRRTNVLYHSLDKVGKERNTAKERRSQRASGTCSCTRFQSFIKPLDPQPLAQRLHIWGQYIYQEK